MELIKPYFAQYVAILEKVVAERDREFAEVFMNAMSPAFMADAAAEKAREET